MKIYAGPCLIQNTQESIDNAHKTAMRLAEINKDIFFRCKLWGGGFTYEKYVNGIGKEGLQVLKDIKRESGLRVGIEIRTFYEMATIFNVCDYIWIGARNSQNYSLLEALGHFIKSCEKLIPVSIKRSPGMTYEEVWGIYDICEKRFGFKPAMIERGINTFAKILPKTRWLTDFNSMISLIKDRPDIELAYDPSHASGDSNLIFPLVKASYAIGVRNYMFEVYDNPEITNTDKFQALDIKEFLKIHNWLIH
jgi:3-deoxy-D-arabino-heptulosonate 7-phosphate (DAHP) synthase